MQGDYLRAIDCFWRSYRIKKKNFKDNSWHRIDSAEYLGKAYFAIDQLKEAKYWFKIVIKKNKDYEEYKDYQFWAKINNILGEISLRTRKVKRKKDRESDYNSFRGSKCFYKRVVNVPEDTYRNKVELSKAFYGIGKAHLEKSRFKTAKENFKKSRFETVKENLEKSKEILNGISNHRRLLIADIRDEIAKLYKSLNKLDASKKEYMESLKFRKEICDKHKIDFVRSYYSRPYSLINRENSGNNGNSCNEQDIEDFQWLKDEIDKIAKFIEEPLSSNKGNDGETNVRILSDNSSDHPGITSGINNKKSNMKDTTANISPVKNRNSKTNDNYQKTATSKTFVPISQKQDVMHRSISYIDLSDSFSHFEFDDNEDQMNYFIPDKNAKLAMCFVNQLLTVERGERIANEKLLTSKVITDTARLSESRSELAPPNASNKNLNASEPEINGLNSIKTGHSQSKLSEPKTTARKFVSMKNRDESSVLTIARTAIKEFQEAYETAFDGGECLNNFANIMLIGPNHDGKSFIYKSLTKQPESSSNGAPVLINLDSIKQASNSDEKIIFDIQSFIDSKVLSVIEKQGNISRNSELQRIFFTALEKGNDQPSDKSRITVPSSDKVSVDNIDIGYHLNDNDNEITRTNYTDNNIISLLKETAKHLSSPSFSRCFQKFYQRSKYYHDNRFAKIWNFDNHSYYQPFKFQYNVYIAPFDVSFKQDEIDIDDYSAVHYHRAKYSSKQNYDIIVEKSGSHIRIQYYYEDIDESKENDQIATEEISELPSNDQLCIHFKTLLSKIVKDAHPEQQEIDCEYFFPCLKCDQLIPWPSNSVAQIIKCANTKCRAKNKLADMKGWNSAFAATIRMATFYLILLIVKLFLVRLFYCGPSFIQYGYD
ncbi:uncharacterized protein TRIADDRAFT_61612 [Trichoplax adhaerens]|uniref:Uncharacterized protein n=1 Tax=Trichoplax adhaerens TaxID=10228 RepID=B3SBG8_TRIAD|nr:predicted protein [Trichoplax adhaerens]EDV20002.1 predicted protein [Trichoplax adhaerens]|eukprot:XP_002117592.1 predicted protein [Trichoplax adhaerens]